MLNKLSIGATIVMIVFILHSLNTGTNGAPPAKTAPRQVPTNAPIPTVVPETINIKFPVIEGFYLSAWACGEGMPIADLQPRLQVVGQQIFITYPTIQDQGNQPPHYAWATAITPVRTDEVVFRYWSDGCLLPVRVGDEPTQGQAVQAEPPGKLPAPEAVYLSGWACGNNRDLDINQIAPQLQITEGVLVVSYLVNQNNEQFAWGTYIAPIQTNVALRYWSDECPMPASIG